MSPRIAKATTHRPEWLPWHPQVVRSNLSGFYGLCNGDRVCVGRVFGWLDGTSDSGEAFVTFDSGQHATVRWDVVKSATKRR